jgi:predicted transcriptional regulator
LEKKVISGRPSLLKTVLKTRKKKSSDEPLKEMGKVLSTASNIDALKIFSAAQQGIISSTDTIKELNLTQKRYYTHLKNLLESGLIEKVDNVYKQTTLGKICGKLADALQSALDSKERLELIDRVKKVQNISVEETEEIMQAILKDTNFVSGERLTDILGPVKMSDTWEKVVDDVVKYLNNAEESVYFATPYMDSNVIDCAFKASQRGVKLNFLTSNKDQITNGIKMMFKTLFTHPRALKNLFQLFNSPKLQIRCVELPYTFIVVDNKYAMVEVVKPYAKTFSLAFFFHNERICGRLIDNFNILWEKGSEVKNMFKKFSKEID